MNDILSEQGCGMNIRLNIHRSAGRWLHRKFYMNRYRTRRYLFDSNFQNPET